MPRPMGEGFSSRGIKPLPQLPMGRRASVLQTPLRVNSKPASAKQTPYNEFFSPRSPRFSVRLRLRGVNYDARFVNTTCVAWGDGTCSVR